MPFAFPSESAFAFSGILSRNQTGKLDTDAGCVLLGPDHHPGDRTEVVLRQRGDRVFLHVPEAFGGALKVRLEEVGSDSPAGHSTEFCNQENREPSTLYY